MNRTIQNTDTFLKARLAAYPDFDMSDYELLVRELDAVQQLYFESLRPECAVCGASASAALETNLSEVVTESGCVLEECDVLAATIGGTSLPFVSPAEFLDGRSGCFTVYGGKVRFRPASTPQSAAVLLVCRKRPAHLTVSAQTCSGGVFIPEKHLPMFFCKMKECIARFVGDDRDADLWARAYNEWIDVLSSYRAEGPASCGGAADPAWRAKL